MKNILIANIFGIGDVLFTTPLMGNLKKHIEGVSVDYLCNARTRFILESSPDVDQIFEYEKDDLTEKWRRSKTEGARYLSGLFSGIKAKKYDIVFDFTMSRKFGGLFKLAGIPRRIGLDYRKRGLFLTDKYVFSGFERQHVIEYYLDLLAFLNVPASIRNMELIADETETEWARKYLKDNGIEEAGPIAAVIPGGGASWGESASRKRWPSEMFARTADMLDQRGVNVLILGDALEKPLCDEVAHSMEADPGLVENRLTLKKYMALLSLCDIVLCNDGGPLHMAVAMGVKTVSIFGPVDERVYGPYPVSDSHMVITALEAVCRPCYSRFKLPECGYDNVCLTGIKPERVSEACFELLGLEEKV